MSIVSPPIARPSSQNVDPVVIGHRGSSATHSENTVAAFVEAFRAGAKAVELDVIPTRDGVLAVTHDFYTPEGVSVRNALFHELVGIPRLEEVAQIPGGVLDIEIKVRHGLGLRDSDYAAMVIASIRGTGIEKRVIVRSFHPDILREIHRLAPDLPLAALTRNPLHDWVRLAKRTHAGVISPHHGIVSQRRVRRAQRAGLFVMPWTANSPSTWQRMIAAGVDGIITDDPAALIEYLANRPRERRRRETKLWQVK